MKFVNNHGVFLSTVEKALDYFSNCGEYSMEEMDRFRKWKFS